MDALEATIAKFPETFTLRAFSDKTFRIAPWPASFMDNGNVHLVVQVDRKGVWLDFIRTTESELRQVKEESEGWQNFIRTTESELRQEVREIKQETL